MKPFFRYSVLYIESSSGDNLKRTDNEKDNTCSNSARLPGRMWNFLYVIHK